MACGAACPDELLIALRATLDRPRRSLEERIASSWPPTHAVAAYPDGVERVVRWEDDLPAGHELGDVEVIELKSELALVGSMSDDGRRTQRRLSAASVGVRQMA